MAPQTSVDFNQLKRLICRGFVSVSRREIFTLCSIFCLFLLIIFLVCAESKEPFDWVVYLYLASHVAIGRDEAS
jgi:hypothetical protein